MQPSHKSRTDLTQHLEQSWEAAKSGQGSFVHITGPVGCGKSTLISRFLDGLKGEDEQCSVIAYRGGDQAMVRSTDHGEIEELVARIAEGLRAVDSGMTAEESNSEQNVPWLLPSADFLVAAVEIASLPSVAESPPNTSRPAIYAGLLVDVARERPVLLVIDDLHRTDVHSRRLMDALRRAIQADERVRLMVVATSSDPLYLEGEEPPEDVFEETTTMGPMGADALGDLIVRRLSATGRPAPEFMTRIAEASEGNPLICEAIVSMAERSDGLVHQADGLTDEALENRPEFRRLQTLARGEFPHIPAHILADLQTAAVAGVHFTTELLAMIWSVPPEAAVIRIDAMVSTGMINPEGNGWAFISSEISCWCADGLNEGERLQMHGRIAASLRALARAPGGRPVAPGAFMDVTENWTDGRTRDRRIKKELETLWSAARQFAAAQRHSESAESAVTFVERLFETSGGQPYLAGRFGRRADRERRHRIYAALTEAAAQLEMAERPIENRVRGSELLDIKVRLLTVRTRFKEVMGDFVEARRTADMAVELGMHLEVPSVRLEAMRVQLEVCYASGDTNVAREALVRLLSELSIAPRNDAIRIYSWLAEAFGRWEWPGLHSRLFPYILQQMQQFGAHRESLAARLEWLAVAVQVEDSNSMDQLLELSVQDAQRFGEMAYLSELLSRYAADLIQSRADTHFDLLSGEFYPPDLFGEGMGPTAVSLVDRLAHPVSLMGRAAELVESAANRLAELRVSTTMLGIIYETRERFAELLERWLPIHGESKPIRLTELMEALDEGFFGLEQVEALTERIIQLAGELSLDQAMADTIYEALDRELPQAMKRRGTLFSLARDSYERIGDAYGLVTLTLVAVRHADQLKESRSEALNAGLELFENSTEQLTAEQRAFIHLRFGELLLDDAGHHELGCSHLERALRLYDEVGDVEHAQVAGEILKEVYRKSGDLVGYRAVRERFSNVDLLSPGLDPLGLEIRIEHLLRKARQEPNDEVAIGMVERCVQLFGRIPDGTTRIDECFVEISKICRRRAEEAFEAGAEAGFHDWLRRSLDAVRIATSINRSLGNYYRVFEEYHELFDDLLQLGHYEEYLRVRAENRDLAFAVGNVAELLYLFEEHLQYDAESGEQVILLPEVRGFYEALIRYLLGVGALEQALSIQGAFVGFLTALGEIELANHYRQRTLFH